MVEKQAGASAPVIGKEGLLRLVEWAERLRSGDSEARERSQTGASSPDGGAEQIPGDRVVDVVPGGEPGRGSGITEHAPGAVGGWAGGGGDRG